MNPVSISLPPGAEASNYLYADMELDDLTQDVLTVRLANGYHIDVGWYPEHDPKGQYIIRVFYGSWDNQRLDPPSTANDVSRVVSIVETLALHFSQTQVPASRTGITNASKILMPTA